MVLGKEKAETIFLTLSQCLKTTSPDRHRGLGVHNHRNLRGIDAHKPLLGARGCVNLYCCGRLPLGYPYQFNETSKIIYLYLSTYLPDCLAILCDEAYQESLFTNFWIKSKLQKMTGWWFGT